jgi:hypothetical protein
MGENLDLVTISTFPSATDAQIAKGVLDDAGIESMIRADDGGGMFPAIGGVNLVVRREDFDKAQDALQQT